MSSRNPTPPPDMSSLTGGPNALLGRFGNRGGSPAAPDPAPAPPPAPKVPARRKPSDDTMDRRSWYMSKAVAGALAEEVEELHFTTRRPKHEVLAALITVAMEHRDEVRARLTDRK